MNSYKERLVGLFLEQRISSLLETPVVTASGQRVKPSVNPEFERRIMAARHGPKFRTALRPLGKLVRRLHGGKETVTPEEAERRAVKAFAKASTSRSGARPSGPRSLMGIPRLIFDPHT